MSASNLSAPARALNLFKKTNKRHQLNRISNFAIRKLNAIPTFNKEAEAWFDIAERGYEIDMLDRIAA